MPLCQEQKDDDDDDNDDSHGIDNVGFRTKLQSNNELAKPSGDPENTPSSNEKQRENECVGG